MKQVYNLETLQTGYDSMIMASRQRKNKVGNNWSSFYHALKLRLFLPSSKVSPLSVRPFINAHISLNSGRSRTARAKRIKPQKIPRIQSDTLGDIMSAKSQPYYLLR